MKDINSTTRVAVLFTMVILIQRDICITKPCAESNTVTNGLAIWHMTNFEKHTPLSLTLKTLQDQWVPGPKSSILIITYLTVVDHEQIAPFSRCIMYVLMWDTRRIRGPGMLCNRGQEYQPSESSPLVVYNAPEGQNVGKNHLENM